MGHIQALNKGVAATSSYLLGKREVSGTGGRGWLMYRARTQVPSSAVTSHPANKILIAFLCCLVSIPIFLGMTNKWFCRLS